MLRPKKMSTKVKAQNRNDEKSDPTFTQWAKFKKEMLNSFPSPYRGEKDSLAEVILIHKYQLC